MRMRPPKPNLISDRTSYDQVKVLAIGIGGLVAGFALGMLACKLF